MTRVLTSTGKTVPSRRRCLVSKTSPCPEPISLEPLLESDPGLRGEDVADVAVEEVFALVAVSLEGPIVRLDDAEPTVEEHQDVVGEPGQVPEVPLQRQATKLLFVLSHAEDLELPPPPEQGHRGDRRGERGAQQEQPDCALAQRGVDLLLVHLEDD